MVARHEGLAGRRDELRALTAKRLRQQKPRRGFVVERRRVELHELHVGDPRPGSLRRRDPIAGRTRWVRCSAKTWPAPPVASNGVGRDEPCTRLARRRGIGRRRTASSTDATDRSVFEHRIRVVRAASEQRADLSHPWRRRVQHAPQVSGRPRGRRPTAPRGRGRSGRPSGELRALRGPSSTTARTTARRTGLPTTIVSAR